jgi:glyoxylase-like metal-dependent hydrolase (beta-lactamase superfamily II)
MTGPGTNTYLVGTTSLAVIDPGPEDSTHLAAILEAAASLGTIRHILVTHTHRDHAPGAAALAEASAAPVIGFGPAEDFAPDECVGDGWTLSVASGCTLEAIHTPGHASDHLCWLLQEQSILMTGDHVMHGSTVVIRPTDGDLDHYLASLSKVRDFAPAIQLLAPGHGRMMDRVTEVTDSLIAHRLGRHARVAEALQALGDGAADNAVTIDELLPTVYADVTEAQLPVARYSLWAHLRSLAAAHEAEALDAAPSDDTIESRWRTLGRFFTE